MPTCFVIQPFDGGPFDQRFDEVIKPAIEEAGLTAYRVDRDPAASVPIEEIERRIRAAEVCLADISQPNPNVWFEVGFAIAAAKPVVFVCQRELVDRLPFDVQHRNVTFYRTATPTDFKVLATAIAERLKAEMAKVKEQIALTDAAVVANVAGISIFETAALATIAANADTPMGEVAASEIRSDMQKQGYTRIAFTAAIAGLMKKSLVEAGDAQNDFGNYFTVYSLTSTGVDWLLANQNSLRLRLEEPPDDDVPF
jgi:hypothetical protein